MSYQFDWGDGSMSDWSPLAMPEDTFDLWHVYRQGGGFAVSARTRYRHEQSSDWSAPQTIVVSVAGPFVPIPLAFPDTAYLESTYAFRAIVTHASGESTACEFHWSDSIIQQTDYVSSGDTAIVRRRFSRLGPIEVRFRGVDARGNRGPWAPVDTITVAARPLVPPRRLRLFSYGGVFVQLAWDGMRPLDSAQYRVWFRATNSTGFVLVGVLNRTTFIHDPGGATGDYTVSSLRGGEEIFAQETVSTRPVLTDTLVLGELNSGLTAGYGWDRVTGRAALYPMTDSASADLVDIYFTDFTSGYLGPGYYLASASLAPTDPGGGVPAGAWRRTRLLGLPSGGGDPLPEYDSLLYLDRLDVNTFVSYAALHTPEGHYAFVTAISPSSVDGTVRIVGLFQRIPGLRLIQYAGHQ